MTFAEWKQFTPDAAARELHRRARTFLSDVQQRAVLAQLASHEQLAAGFAAANRAGPLGGVPYFAKDLFDVAGLPTFAGSTFLPEVRQTPPRDAESVRALREAGAVFAGKTHLHEFAYGITGENPHYGDCEHPRFPGRTTGGSSSGSAAAVAAGIVPFALGTDTGGSVRLPAAFCGLFGFRLTPRDHFIADAFPLAPSFDTAGWFTANAADMRTVTQALCGADSLSREPRGCYLEMPGVDADVSASCRSESERLLQSRDPETQHALAAAFSSAAETYHTIVAQEAWQVHHTWVENYRTRYDPVVWQRLERIHALTEIEIARAHARLESVKVAWREFFQQYDFLVLPAAPCGALTKAECNLENRQRILTLTAPASVGGLPVLTVPVALPSGLSSGLQIVVSHPRSPVIGWALGKFSG